MIETTDFSKSEQYTLSIRLSTDGFSFSIFNPLGEGKFSFHEHGVDDSLSLTANLKQAFRETDWLKNPFRRINVLMTGKRFTFIPLDFLRTNRRKPYSIIITPDKTTNWCNTTSCIRTI